jgi:hypothetical protein
MQFPQFWCSNQFLSCLVLMSNHRNSNIQSQSASILIYLQFSYLLQVVLVLSSRARSDGRWPAQGAGAVQVVSAGGWRRWAAPTSRAGGGRRRWPATQIALPCSMWRRRRQIDARFSLWRPRGVRIAKTDGQTELHLLSRDDMNGKGSRMQLTWRTKVHGPNWPDELTCFANCIILPPE